MSFWANSARARILENVSGAAAVSSLALRETVSSKERRDSLSPAYQAPMSAQPVNERTPESADLSRTRSRPARARSSGM